MQKNKSAEREYVCGCIKNYLISELIERTHNEPKCEEKINTLIALVHDNIDDFCAAIYKQKDVISESVLHEYLEKYIENLKEQFYKINLNKNDYKIKDYFDACLTTSRIFRKEKYSTYYEGISENQDEILRIYRDLAYKLGINDSLKLSHFYTKLLWDGYFSISNNHTYKMKDRLITYLFNLEVFQGRGVCLNYASLQEDFLTMCGKDSYLVICNVEPANLNRKDEDEVNINRDIDVTIGDKMKMILLSPIKLTKKESGNHAIVMISGEKGIYYYDATNLIVYNPNGSEKADAINADGYVPMKLNSSFFTPKSSFIRRNILDLVLKNKKYDTYTKDEVKDTYDYVIKLMDDNKELINSAYFEARPYIENINKIINEHKKDFTFTGMLKNFHRSRKK